MERLRRALLVSIALALLVLGPPIILDRALVGQGAWVVAELPLLAWWPPRWGLDDEAPTLPPAHCVPKLPPSPALQAAAVDDGWSVHDLISAHLDGIETEDSSRGRVGTDSDTPADGCDGDGAPVGEGAVESIAQRTRCGLDDDAPRAEADESALPGRATPVTPAPAGTYSLAWSSNGDYRSDVTIQEPPVEGVRTPALVTSRHGSHSVTYSATAFLDAAGTLHIDARDAVISHSTTTWSPDSFAIDAYGQVRTADNQPEQGGGWVVPPQQELENLPEPARKADETPAGQVLVFIALEPQGIMRFQAGRTTRGRPIR